VSDYFDTLHLLVLDDLDAPPLPPAEVRRLGDQLRHRRIAVQAIAVTVATALVALLVATALGESHTTAGPIPGTFATASDRGM
jgi:hypothetical protein